MICALVLAAGRSRRMGAQKLLLPVAGQPMIARVVDQVLASPVDQVLVVIGPDGKPIKESLAGRRVRFVANPRAEGEMLASVRCGLAATPPQCVAVLVVLGDQPGVTADVIAALVRAFQTGRRGIVVPTHGGRRGHPLLFAARYRDEIMNRHEAVGLRGLLQAHPKDVAELEVTTPGVLEDVDLPEDYRRVAPLAAPKETTHNGGIVTTCGTRSRPMQTPVELPKAFSVRDDHEFHPFQHLVARLNPQLRVVQVATGVHVNGGPTVFWGLIYLEGRPPTGNEVEAALREAGFDLAHNVLVQASGVWSGNRERTG